MAVRLMSEKSELYTENGTMKFAGVVAADAKADVTDNLTFDTTFDWATCDSNGHWTWQ